jgi:DNA-binding NtrC family response regulator
MSLQQGSVLVVDDELSLRKVLRISSAASGFAVEEARNSEEALGSELGMPRTTLESKIKSLRINKHQFKCA